MMLKALILATLSVVYVYLCGPVLFSRAPLLSKFRRVPIKTAVFAVLALMSINGFRDNSEVSAPDKSTLTRAADVEATSAIPQITMPEPLHPQDAAAACLEYARNEAQTMDDFVAETWLSSVEGYLATGPEEISLQLAVGPRAGPPQGPQCRSEARLTCKVIGQDVRPVTPLHMTGNKIAC
jgi:hypothetical protein